MAAWLVLSCFVFLKRLKKKDQAGKGLFFSGGPLVAGMHGSAVFIRRALGPGIRPGIAAVWVGKAPREYNSVSD